VEKISRLSTDCLIEQLRDTFNVWKAALAEIKSLVSFVPKFMAIQPLANSRFEEVSEDYLMKQIMGMSFLGLFFAGFTWVGSLSVAEWMRSRKARRGPVVASVEALPAVESRSRAHSDWIASPPEARSSTR
jgi:hypothetical protein